MSVDDIETANPTCWIITDGKKGMEVQVEGVAQALGIPYQTKYVNPRGPWRWLAPWAPPDPRDRPGKADGGFALPYPDLALATGRLSIPLIRALKASSPQTLTIVIQDPRTGTRTADLIAVPAHDALNGDNVIKTLTAPHGFSPERLSQLRQKMPEQLKGLPRPKVVVVLGGPNKVYGFTPEDSDRLAVSLASLASLGASFLVTPSRRTPDHTIKAVQAAIAKAPHIIWSGEGDNPYAHWLAHGDHFIVTADSVNMTGEACVTGKPVYVFHPQGGSKKFNAFHESLRRYGATKILPNALQNIESWEYAPLDSATEIANEIRKRWPQLRL